MNNVETLVNVLDIVREGGAAYAAIGTDGSTGTELFCVAGSVARPGVYEVPFGTTLRALLELAGGVPSVPDGEIAAILLGGAAGSFVTAEHLDLPLTFEDARRDGVSLDSGTVTVFDGSVDLVAVALRIAAFFRDESCGKCVPCRVGTVRQEEALHRFARSRRSGVDRRGGRAARRHHRGHDRRLDLRPSGRPPGARPAPRSRSICSQQGRRAT